MWRTLTTVTTSLPLSLLPIAPPIATFPTFGSIFCSDSYWPELWGSTGSSSSQLSWRWRMESMGWRSLSSAWLTLSRCDSPVGIPNHSHRDTCESCTPASSSQLLLPLFPLFKAVVWCHLLELWSRPLCLEFLCIKSQTTAICYFIKIHYLREKENAVLFRFVSALLPWLEGICRLFYVNIFQLFYRVPVFTLNFQSISFYRHALLLHLAQLYFGFFLCKVCTWS